MSWAPRKLVVVPVDFSRFSDEAVTVALELAGAADAVHVIHVSAPPIVMALGEAAFETPEDDYKLAERRLKQFIEQRSFHGVTAIVRDGDPGLQIADYAQHVGADLIVMPSHGYHGVKRLLLGSVTERVLRHAHCAVLVLRRTD